MRKNILLVVCVVLLFGVSCRKADTTFSVPDFPKKGTIASNKINDTLLMTYPFEMFVTDNNIYVLAYVGGTFIQVYDKSDGHYVGSGAVMGRGPGELLAGVNMYYDSGECKQYPNFKYCQMWGEFNITDEQFQNEFNQYVSSLKTNVSSAKEGKSDMVEVLLDTLQNNIFMLVLLGIVIIITIIGFHFSKKRRR